MRKKLFTLLLAIIASMGTTFAWDYVRVKIGSLYYNLDDKNRKAEVTSKLDVLGGYSSSLTITSASIPSSVSYSGKTYQVTAIGESAFQNCSTLKSVTIPNCITSIGIYAFRGCTGLTSVAIPNSVTSIRGGAFQDCSGLTSVTIPNSITSIDDAAFQNCSHLPVENNIRYAGTFLVEAVNKTLSSYSIKSGTKWIGSYAFRDCSNLISITIPNSVISIGGMAFLGCSGLTSVTIGNSVTSIGMEAFRDCTGLTSVTIPNSVTSIVYGAFRGCTGLTSIIIPNSVTSIGSMALSRCTGLLSVEIPNSVTSIGDGAFNGVRNIVYTGSAKGAPWGENCINGLVDGYFVYKDATKAILLGCSSAVTGSIAIPNSVTSIGEDAFWGCTGLTSIEIPNSVTSIGDYAFYECTGLTSVTIGNSVTNIGNNAFYGCNGLTSVIWNAENSADFASNNTPFYYLRSQITSFTFGNKVEHIPANLCNGMSNLTSVTIANSVTSIGNNAFQGCTGLTSVTIANSVTSIGNNAFQGCTGLTSVTINSDSVTNNLNLSNIFGPQVQQYIIGSDITGFGNNIFQNCNSLTSILVDDSNSIYDSRNNCNAIIETATNVLIRGCKNTIIPDEVTSIGSWAFAYCSGLTSISLDNNITSIGEYAFYKSGLTSVTINDNMTNIGGNAFSGCSALTSVVWNHKNGPSCNFGNQVTSFTFGNDVEVIPASICAGMTNLTSITIPNSVTSIGENAFKNCNNLTSVTIESESIISKNYTSYENNIDEIFGRQVSQYIIGDGITTIGDKAFYLCSSLTSVTIGNSVTSIGYMAFQGTNINIINFTGTLEDWLNKTWSQTSVSGNYKLLLNGVLQESIIFPNSVTSIGDNAFQGCSGLTSVTIPNSVNNIGSSAFQGCSGLTSVTIPNSVTNIGNSAFYGCTGLTSVTIGNSVTSIGERAFYNCSGLTSVTIPNSVTSIGNYAFRDCTGLATVTIGNSVTSIGERAFYNCSGLTKVNITDIAAWCNIAFRDNFSNPLYNAHNLYVNDELVTDLVIPNSVTSIGNNAFSGCSGLTSVTIPNSVTSIGGGAFYDCSGLTSVTIGNSVTNIGDDAFSDCSGLTSITIPDSVARIGRRAFRNCSGLTSVTSLATTPPACPYYYLSEMAFAGVDCSNIPLYVPTESVSLYQAANIWKEFNVIGVMFADEVETAVFSATPTDDYGVVLEWQAVENATLYNIEIKQGNNTVRQLQFDSNGKLLNNPSNAPSRYANVRYSSTAIHSDNGWRYELNDLDPGTSYTYSITVKAENGSVLYSQSIGFTTKEETFIIKFVNWNGEELLVLPEVVKGTTPSYTGETPVRPNTAEYTYTFVGWTPAIVAATSDTTYTATYTATKNSYTITWQNEDGSLIDQTTVEYGVVPTHAEPTKEATAEYTYTFAGWTPAVEAVTGDATYKATFSSVVNVYTITVSAVNGQVIGGGEYRYGAIIDLTAIPNEGYVFDQWSDGVTDNPRTITVTGDVEYTALFKSAEGLENIYTSEPVQKVMIDQKVYILRGEKVYTVTGQEVK